MNRIIFLTCMVRMPKSRGRLPTTASSHAAWLNAEFLFSRLFHRGWDQHGNLPNLIKLQCQDIDQPASALVRDLKMRGMLKDTLVVCGGEFGRTIYSQGQLSKDSHGRDHHGRCFSMWMAGGGIKAGYEHGETDDFSYNIVKDPVHIRGFQCHNTPLPGN